MLFGGSVFTIFAGIYYWFPKMTGRMYNEKLGKLHFWLTYHRLNATCSSRCTSSACAGHEPPHLRLRAEVRNLELGHLGSRRSSWVRSFLIFLYNMIASWRRGERAVANPWRAMTLEWQVSSPPPIFNFDEIPQVVGSPYEYGVPGARHAVFNGDRARLNW